jgi:hypothetical protein
MQAQCASCGEVSWQSKDFHLRRGFLRKQQLCARCWRTAGEKEARTYFGLCLLALPILLGWVYFRPDPGLQWLLLNLVLLYLAVIPATAIHELGHVLMAKAVGWDVFKVMIGVLGKNLWTGVIKGIVVEVKALPSGGMAYAAPRDSRFFRVKASLVLAAGGLFNLLTAAVIFAWTGWELSRISWFVDPLRLFAWVNLFLMVISLFPSNTNVGGVALRTDGLLLCQALTRSKELREEFVATGVVLRVERLRLAGNYKEAERLLEAALQQCPGHVLLLHTRALLHLDAREYARGRQMYLDMLHRPLEHPAYEYLILNNIAWTDVMIGDPNLLAEADQFSNRALVGLGTIPAVRVTRGAVLIMTNKAGEGVQLIQTAYPEVETPKENKALTAAILSIGYSKLGKLPEAEQWRQTAASLDPLCPLLNRTKEENVSADSA